MADVLKLTKTPPPPYYAVIFSFVHSGLDQAEYNALMSVLTARAKEIPGFIGEDAARTESGFGMSVSYWRDAESIKTFHQDTEHIAAQKLGYKKFYECFELRVAKVERAYDFYRNDQA